MTHSISSELALSATAEAALAESQATWISDARKSVIPTFSVLVPCYNCAPYLRAAIGSLIEQTCQDFEVIVVDDGSTDSPDETVRDWLPRLTFVRTRNRGLAASRNLALALSRGRFITLLDADDYLDKGHLESMLRFIEAHPEADAISPELILIGDTPNAGKRLSHIDNRGYLVDLRSFLLGRTALSGCSTYRASVMKSLGYAPQLRHSEDYHLWTRLLVRGFNVQYNREALYFYRRHAASLTGQSAQKSISHLIDVIELLSRTEASDAYVAQLLHEVHRHFSDQLLIERFRDAAAAGDIQQARTLGRQLPVESIGDPLRRRKLTLLCHGYRLAPALTRSAVRFFTRNR